MMPSDHPGSGWGGRRENAGRKPAPKDNDSYSLGRALASMLDGRGPTGIELEYDLAERAARSKLGSTSFFATEYTNVPTLRVPFSVLRDLTAGGTGAALIGEEKQLISPLLTHSAAVQAGSTVLEGLTENVSLAAVTKLPEPTWQPESGFSIETDPLFGAVPLGPPKRVCGLVRASRQLLMSASPGLDQLLIDDLARACSSQLDKTVFYGDPVANANQPRGIINTPGIHRVDTGIITPAWEDFTEARRLIEDEDVGIANFAFVTQPDLKAELSRRPQWGDGGGLSVWDALPRAIASKAITGEHDIFFGAFSPGLVIGLWGSAADVVVNRFTQARAGQVDIVCNLWCSFAIRSPRLFGLMNVEYLHRIARKAEAESAVKPEAQSEPEPAANHKKK